MNGVVFFQKRKRLGKAICSPVCCYLIGDTYFKNVTDSQPRVVWVGSLASVIYNSLSKHSTVPVNTPSFENWGFSFSVNIL